MDDDDDDEEEIDLDSEQPTIIHQHHQHHAVLWDETVNPKFNLAETVKIIEQSGSEFFA